MSLQSQIRNDMVAAMKSRDKNTVELLRVVAGEFGREMNNGIELQDDQVTAILKRMKKDAIIMGNLNEVEILNKYLPTILGETQIKTIVGGIIQKNGYSGMQNMGKVMGTLKTQKNGYSGMQNMGKVMGTLKTHPMSAQIDNKIASRITKELLTQ